MQQAIQIQRLLIARFAIRHQLSESTAASLWIGKHAAQFRRWWERRTK